MSKDSVTVCTVIAIALFASVLSVIIVSPSSDREIPFEGELSHDFGEVWLGDTAATLEHTFELTNTQTDTIIVEDWAATCGCTGTTIVDTEVSPGEVLSVVVMLTMADPIRRSERIALNLGSHGLLNLQIDATARRLKNVALSAESVDLTREGTAVVAVVATFHDETARPPLPVFSVPDTVHAEFSGWRHVLTRDRDSNRPDRWHGEMLLSRVSDKQPRRGTRVWIEFPGRDAIGIELTGRPWAVEPRLEQTIDAGRPSLDQTRGWMTLRRVATFPE